MTSKSSSKKKSENHETYKYQSFDEYGCHGKDEVKKISAEI